MDRQPGDVSDLLNARMAVWRVASKTLPEAPGSEEFKTLFSSDEGVSCRDYAAASSAAARASAAAHLAGYTAAGETYGYWSTAWAADYILCSALG